MTEAFEGPTLEDALDAAAAAFDVDPEQIDYSYDRAHFSSGAASVRIFAAAKDPKSAILASDVSAKVRDMVDERNLDLTVRANATAIEVHVQLGHMPEADTSAVMALSDDLKDGLAELIEGRRLRVHLRRRDPRRAKPPKDEAADEELRDRTREAIEQVTAGSEAKVTLEDLNSYQRWIVHSLVRDTDGVRSQSFGRGARKTIEITAEK